MYGETIPVLQLVRAIAAVMQEFTQSGGVRPFGVSILIAGVDDEGPQLFQVDPSGAYFGWRATAIGKNFTNAKTFLEKRYAPDMELEDAVHTALLTVRTLRAQPRPHAGRPRSRPSRRRPPPLPPPPPPSCARGSRAR